MEEVTGRDNQIIREALSIAIPLMLRHSLAWSNTKDMMAIVEAYGGRTPTNLLNGNELKTFLVNTIEELKSGKRHKADPRTDTMGALIDKYLEQITDRELKEYY